MTDSSANTDSVLLQALANDDEPAFAALYHKYHRKLFYFILNFTHSQQTAEDALHQIPETIAPEVLQEITIWIKTI